MKGITVTLLERVQTGTDPFGVPVYSWQETEVENVLVAPSSAGGEEVLEATNLQGREAQYTMALPKGDNHHWEGNRVRFFGETWSVIGKPTEGIEALIPLQWNRKVRVERIVF